MNDANVMNAVMGGDFDHAFSEEAAQMLREHPETKELREWLCGLDRDYAATLVEIAMEKRLIWLLPEEKERKQELAMLALVAAVALAPFCTKLKLTAAEVRRDVDRLDKGAVVAAKMLRENMEEDKVFRRDRPNDPHDGPHGDLTTDADPTDRV